MGQRERHRMNDCHGTKPFGLPSRCTTKVVHDANALCAVPISSRLIFLLYICVYIYMCIIIFIFIHGGEGGEAVASLHSAVNAHGPGAACVHAPPLSREGALHASRTGFSRAILVFTLVVVVIALVVVRGGEWRSGDRRCRPEGCSSVEELM